MYTKNICIYIYIQTCFSDSRTGGTVYFCIFLHHGHPANIHYWSELGFLKEFLTHYRQRAFEGFPTHYR